MARMPSSFIHFHEKHIFFKKSFLFCIISKHLVSIYITLFPITMK